MGFCHFRTVTENGFTSLRLLLSESEVGGEQIFFIYEYSCKWYHYNTHRIWYSHLRFSYHCFISPIVIYVDKFHCIKKKKSVIILSCLRINRKKIDKQLEKITDNILVCVKD